MLSKRYESTEVDRRTWLHLLVIYQSLQGVHTARVSSTSLSSAYAVDNVCRNRTKCVTVNSTPSPSFSY